MLDTEVREPTVLAFGLAVTGLVILAGVCAAFFIFLPVTGYLGWVFTAIALVTAWLILGLLRKRRPAAGASTG